MITKLGAAIIIIVLGIDAAVAQDSQAVCFSNSSPGAVIPACDELIDADPRHAQAHQARGVAWYKLGDYERAIADYTASIEIDPKYIRAYYNRALAWEALGQLQNALNDLRIFRSLDPSFPDAQQAINRIDKRLKPKTATAVAGNAVFSTGRPGEEVIKMERSGGVLWFPFASTKLLPLTR